MKNFLVNVGAVGLFLVCLTIPLSVLTGVWVVIDYLI